MATLHLHIRTQVVGDAATVKKIKGLADELAKAVTEAGGDAGSATVVDEEADAKAAEAEAKAAEAAGAKPADSKALKAR
jgi:hypothetical protein